MTPTRDDRVLAEHDGALLELKRSDRTALAVWRDANASPHVRVVWTDVYGRGYVQRPGLADFVNLDSPEVSSYVLDPPRDSHWHEVGESEYVRMSESGDDQAYELLSICSTDDFSQADERDQFRAYLWNIDLDDFDDSKILAVLDYVGYVDLRSNTVDLNVAASIGCAREVGKDTAAQVVDYCGKERLVSDIVSFYGTSWQIPFTYHEQDEGYNTAWRDYYDPELLPWGSLTSDELVSWMSTLGCVEYAPVRSLGDLVLDGFDGVAYVLDDADVDICDRAAFTSPDVAATYAAAIGRRPESIGLSISDGTIIDRIDEPIPVVKPRGVHR